MAADALENALIAALPLGPQSPAGGVSLPDSFHGELQARRRAADPTSYPRASRPLPANLPARAGPYARAGAPACRDCAAGARPAHGAAGGACGAPRPAAAPRACATGRLRKLCFQGRWARQRPRTGAGQGARAAGCRLARARAQVTLLEARNLPVWGFPWQSNPYARVALGGQSVRSRRDDDTSHAGRHRAPVWNQEFQFLVENPASQARPRRRARWRRCARAPPRGARMGAACRRGGARVSLFWSAVAVLPSGGARMAHAAQRGGGARAARAAGRALQGLRAGRGRAAARRRC